MERRIASADRGVLAFTPATRNVAGFLFVLMLPSHLPACDSIADVPVRKPLPMFGPTSRDDCHELAYGWSRYIDQARRCERRCRERANLDSRPDPAEWSGREPRYSTDCLHRDATNNRRSTACNHREADPSPVCHAETEARLRAEAQRDDAVKDCEAALVGDRRQ